MRHYKPFWFRCGGISEFSNSFPNSDRLHNPTKEKKYSLFDCLKFRIFLEQTAKMTRKMQFQTCYRFKRRFKIFALQILKTINVDFRRKLLFFSDACQLKNLISFWTSDQAKWLERNLQCGWAAYPLRRFSPKLLSDSFGYLMHLWPLVW